MRAVQSAPETPAWCKRISTIFLDLDGCVWFGDVPAPGAAQAVSSLREAGKRVVFLSNVSSATRQDIAQKLSGMDIPAAADDVQVPVELLGRHPAFEGRTTGIFAFCAAKVRLALTDLGFELTDSPQEARIVVTGRDPEMTYDDLAAAAQAVLRGAKLVALNLDTQVPLAGGLTVPGTGAIVAALEAATGARVELVGKPSQFFFDQALATFGADPELSLMVGDTLDTDILGGRHAGMRTALVGDGGLTRLQSPPTPDLRLGGIRELPELLS